MNSRTLARWLCALATVLVVVAGLLPAAGEAAGASATPSTPRPAAASTPDDPAGHVEPALLRAVQADPGGRFHVIVQRLAPPSKAQMKSDEVELENEVRARGGDVGPRLGLIQGHAVTLTGHQVLALAAHRLVRAISLDRPVKTHQVAPAGATTTNTTQIASTWTLQANAPQAWTTYGTQGQGVTVAVLDSGIQTSPDLGNVVFGADTATGTTALGDKGGHGTHVAGIIAGNGAQSGGAYEGVAPAARLVSVKVTNDTGAASYSSVIQGLQWVVQNKDAYNIRVANLSLGATASAGYADDPLDAAVEMAWFRGIVIVVSAGNAGPAPGTVSVPGNDPYVITVGAYDDGQVANLAAAAVPAWTSQGPTSFDGLAKPDLAASGRRVVSLRAPGSYLDLQLPDRVTATNYFRLSGTSMAAPVVSGVAALLISKYPNLRPDQVKYVLTHSTHALPFAASLVGSGAVDAQAAMQLAANVGGNRANVGLRANNKAANALWKVIKSMAHPVWRTDGSWNGRYWDSTSWVASGLRNTDGSWNDGSWDTTAWTNFRWEDGSWDAANWLDGSWDTLTALNISLSSGTWDASALND